MADVDIKLVSVDISDVTKSLKDMSLRLKSVEKDTNSLSKSFDSTNKKIASSSRSSAKSIDSLTSSLGKSSSLIKKSESSVNSTTSAFQRFRSKIAESAKSVLRIGRSSDKAAKGMVDLSKKSVTASSSISKVGDSSQSTTSILGKVGPAIVGAFSVTAIAAFLKSMLSLQKEIEQTTLLIRNLTGATGQELTNLTAGVRATIETFGVGQEELVTSINSVSRAFGISTEAALEKIQVGLLEGSNASGELFSILREYPKLLADVGLSADETFNLISQQVKEGVYADKGIDAIKEAGIRLRELTPATREALDAIGLSSRQIEKDLANGSRSLFDVIQDVSKALQSVPDSSAVAGQALADIFGGPGEDAGIKYIRLLSDVDDSFRALTESSDGFRSSQEELLVAEQKLQNVIVQVFKPAEGVFKSLVASAKNFTTEGIVAIADGIVSLINFFRQLNNDSLTFRVTIALVEAAFNNLVESVKFAGRNIFEIFKGIGGAISAAFQGDLLAIGQSIRTTWANIASDALSTSERVFGEGIQKIKDAINAEKLPLLEFDITANITESGVKDIVRDVESKVSSAVSSSSGTVRLPTSLLPIKGEDLTSFRKNVQDITSSFDLKLDDNRSFFEKVFGSGEAGEESKKRAKQALESTLGSLSDITSARSQAAQEQLDIVSNRIDEQQILLDREIELNSLGFASNVENERKALDELNQQKDKALEDRKKAARAQGIIDTATQVSSIATASANILKGFSTIPLIGQILGAAAVAAMITGFVASKARAKAVSQQFFKGGEYSGSGGYTGDGSIFSESTNIGEKPYTYHKREFILNNEKTEKHLPFLRAMHQGSLHTLPVSDPTIQSIIASHGDSSFRIPVKSDVSEKIIELTKEVTRLRRDIKLKKQAVFIPDSKGKLLEYNGISRDSKRNDV